MRVVENHRIQIESLDVIFCVTWLSIISRYISNDIFKYFYNHMQWQIIINNFKFRNTIENLLKLLHEECKLHTFC